MSFSSLGIIKKVWRVWSRQFATFSDGMFYMLFLKPYCPSHDWTFVSVNRIQLLPWRWCLRKKYSSNRRFEVFSNSGRVFQLGEIFPTRGGFWHGAGFLVLRCFFCVPLGFLCPVGFLRSWGPEDLFLAVSCQAGPTIPRGILYPLVFGVTLVFFCGRKIKIDDTFGGVEKLYSVIEWSFKKLPSILKF